MVSFGLMTVSSLCNKVHILLNLVQSMIYFNFYFDCIATAEWPLLTYCSFSCSFVNVLICIIIFILYNMIHFHTLM